MGIFFQFKKPEIRQFNYTPRYYDPQKEEMKERRERIARELKKKEEGEVRRTNLEGSITLERGFLSKQRTTKKAVNGGVFAKALMVCGVIAFMYIVYNKL